MRSWLPALSVLVLIGAAFVSARTADTARVTVRITDDATRKEIPGLIRVTDAAGNVHRPAELLPRGLGLEEKLPIAEWFVLPGATALSLPKSRLTIEAVSGLEREAGRVTLDLTVDGTSEATVRLKRFADTAAEGLRSANTHIHLMKVTREECDRYLREVPRADGLDAVFVSYLERAGADHEYTTNRYTRADLAALEQKSGVKVGNGEEHRHNFEGFGQGYGHVMLLKINQLVQPVSIGPGIMKTGTDGLPLQRGIDAARKDGATILWCHDRWGVEAVPNLATGRLSAVNIFDGGAHGSYRDSFYRYWNADLPVSFSTGTDWFIYDFSRVYAQVEGEVTVDHWLAALRAGRTYITNGPLLTFRVNGKGPGESVAASMGMPIRVEASAKGRTDFRRIELVKNGEVIAAADSRAEGGHFTALLTTEVEGNAPCWLALRTPPPSRKEDPALPTAAPMNELGKEVFAHTTPVSVLPGKRRYFDRSVAEALLREVEENAAMIEKHAKFADDGEKQRVLDVYRDGAEALRRHIGSRSQP